MSYNNRLKIFIKSPKFKYIGNLHRQIITQIITGEENGNSVYNRFGIDNNILNNYKQYYSQLVNSTNINLFDIGQIDLESINKQIRIILTDIYTKLYGNNNELKNIEDIDYITDTFLNEDKNSDENIKGNNILKILANLAAVLDDCFLSFRAAVVKFQLGPKVHVGNTILTDDDDMFIAINQIQTIMKGFGIEIQ